MSETSDRMGPARGLDGSGSKGSGAPPPRARPVAAAIVAAVLAAVAVVGGGCGGSSAAPAEQATVVRVVDGDTVVVRLGGAEETVRLLGIDTPETVKPGAEVECFGPEAAAHLKALLPAGARARVERDVEVRDRFGRLLLHLFPRAEAVSVNQAQVAGGYARVLTIAPNRAHASELSGAAADARRHRRGLWGRCEPG